MLKPFPICNKKMLLNDIRHSGIYWRDNKKEGYRFYLHGEEVEDTDMPCWKLECYEYKGGCGSYISDDNKEDLIVKWNKRTER